LKQETLRIRVPFNWRKSGIKKKICPTNRFFTDLGVTGLAPYQLWFVEDKNILPGNTKNEPRQDGTQANPTATQITAEFRHIATQMIGAYVLTLLSPIQYRSIPIYSQVLLYQQTSIPQSMDSPSQAAKVVALVNPDEIR